MTFTIKRLERSIEKGTPNEVAAQLTLVEGLGIAGDRFSNGGERQICMLDADSETAARAQRGLCSKKFTANLLTDGLDYAALRVGDRLQVADAVIELTKVKKDCYPDCPIPSENRPCAFVDNVAYAKVAQGGVIACGARGQVKYDEKV